LPHVASGAPPCKESRTRPTRKPCEPHDIRGGQTEPATTGD
jgi:hypothetical protein